MLSTTRPRCPQGRRARDLRADGDGEARTSHGHPPEFFNHEQRDEPPATRALGLSPPRRRRLAARPCADLFWELHRSSPRGTWSSCATMAVRTRGTSSPTTSTGEWHRVRADRPVLCHHSRTGNGFRDGLVVEHWAQRDDMAAEQLGWMPPTPPTSCAARSPSGSAKRRRPRRARTAVRPWPLTARRRSRSAHSTSCGAPPSRPFAASTTPTPTTASRTRAARHARGRGPEVFVAATRWLNDAFADLDWVVNNVIADGPRRRAHDRGRPARGADRHVRRARRGGRRSSSRRQVAASPSVRRTGCASPTTAA